MTDRLTVGDLAADRTVYVGPQAGTGTPTRVHLVNDADTCRYTGDLRAVNARCLWDSHAVCLMCSDREVDTSPDQPDVPAIEDAAEVADD